MECYVVYIVLFKFEVLALEVHNRTQIVKVLGNKGGWLPVLLT